MDYDAESATICRTEVMPYTDTREKSFLNVRHRARIPRTHAAG